jgi:hypothetical protein
MVMGHLKKPVGPDGSALKNHADLRHFARSSHKMTFDRTNFITIILEKQPCLLS